VLPPEALRLDFPSALARWDDGDEDSHGNIIVVKDDEDLYSSTVIKDIVLKSLWLAVVVFFFGILSFYLTRQVSEEQILIYNDNLHRPNPDNTGPDLKQGVCSDTSSTEMQCLRPLHHLGAYHCIVA
jgi:hypothetical protein